MDFGGDPQSELIMDGLCLNNYIQDLVGELKKYILYSLHSFKTQLINTGSLFKVQSVVNVESVVNVKSI